MTKLAEDSRAGIIAAELAPLVAKNLELIFKGRTATDFAELFNMCPKEFSRRARGVIHVRIDWVLGWSDSYSCDNSVMRQLLGFEPLQHNKPRKHRAYTEKLRSLLNVHNVRITKQSVIFGFNKNYMYSTLNGDRVMAVHELQWFAEMLDISLEQLIDELF